MLKLVDKFGIININKLLLHRITKQVNFQPFVITLEQIIYLSNY